MSDHVEVEPPANWNAACSCGAIMRDSARRTASEALARHLLREAGGRWTLTDFLLARIAEDETNLREMTNPLEASARIEGAAAPEVRYFANPARVLAECEAKRRIVELHARNADGECTSCAEGFYGCGPAGDPDVFRGTDWPCPTLRSLALPYADHPDYREEWKP